MRYAVLAVLVLTCAPVARARDMGTLVRCPETPVETTLEVFYGNGMDNTLEDARDSLDLLRAFVPSAIGYPEKSIEFALAFNYGEFWLFELIEVFKQKLIEQGEGLLARFLAWQAGFSDEWVAQTTENQFTRLIGDKDLRGHVATYRRALRQGHSVLVVSHSQGNFYVNAAHERLFAAGSPDERFRENFRAVAVASPSSRVAGPRAEACPERGCYTNLDNDWVINAVRLAQDFRTLPGNLTDERDSGDGRHHAFIQTYMGLSTPREQILDHVRWQVEAFPELEVEYHSGVITASLQWDYGADLDLHVFELDETHVYYDNPAGRVGYLDVDSRVGGDELENYFVACEDLKAGDYEFAVGYFDGPGIVDAELGLDVGGRTYYRPSMFSEPRGADADLNPRVLARLRVEEWAERMFLVRRIDPD